VSAPLKIGNSEGGNTTVAIAFVVYDTLQGQFTMAQLLDQALTSVIWALLSSLILFIFMWRWIEGSLQVFTEQVEQNLQSGSTDLQTKTKWPALTRLKEITESLLSKYSTNQGPMNSQFGSNGDSTWATLFVNSSDIPSAALDSNLTVLAWNKSMEQLIGIRANIAVGANISSASRDVQFESFVRELAEMHQSGSWAGDRKKIEFAGRFYFLSMTSGQGTHLLTITPSMEDA
jgi:PAS domain-containing protein